MTDKTIDMTYDKPVALSKWQASYYIHDRESSGYMTVRISFHERHLQRMDWLYPTFDAAKGAVDNVAPFHMDEWIVSRAGDDDHFEYAELYVGNMLWRVEPYSED